MAGESPPTFSIKDEKIMMERTIELSWSTEDIEAQLEQRELKMSDSEIYDVLALMKSGHDATVGINWEVIDVWIDWVIDKRSV